MNIRLLFGTHGDEVILKDSLRYLDEESLKNVTVIDVNKIAIGKGVRYVDFDMNRIGYVESRLNLSYEVQRFYEIIDSDKKYDLTIDIHGSASNCGICVIVTKATLGNIFSALHFPSDRIVIWQSSIQKKSGPITQFLGNAFEIEVGPKEDIALHEKLGNKIHEYLSNIQKYFGNISWNTLLKKEIFIVVAKTGRDYAQYGDFYRVDVNGDNYYTFLSQNNYLSIGSYLMKKVKVKNLICDLGERIDIKTILL